MVVVVVSLKNLSLILALPFKVVDLDFTSLCVVCKMGPFRRFKDTRCAKHKMHIEHPHAQLKFLLLETRDPLTAQALEPRAGGESSCGCDIPRASKHIFPASSSSQRFHHCPDSLPCWSHQLAPRSLRWAAASCSAGPRTTFPGVHLGLGAPGTVLPREPHPIQVRGFQQYPSFTQLLLFALRSASSRSTPP